MFKKLLKLIAVVLMIIALAYLMAGLLVKYGVLTAAQLSWMSFGGLINLTSAASFFIAAGVAAVLAFIISPEGAQIVVERTVEAVKGIASGVGGALSGAVAGLAGGVVSGASGTGLVGYVALGVVVYLGYKWLSKKIDEPSKPQPAVASNNAPALSLSPS